MASATRLHVCRSLADEAVRLTDLSDEATFYEVAFLEDIIFRLRGFPGAHSSTLFWA
jgi:hypothetical protein